MSDKKRLSDNQVHDRLYAAEAALGDDEAATTRGETALTAARKALQLLKIGLIIAAENNDDGIDCIIDTDA